MSAIAMYFAPAVRAHNQKSKSTKPTPKPPAAEETRARVPQADPQHAQPQHQQQPLSTASLLGCNGACPPGIISSDNLLIADDADAVGFEDSGQASGVTFEGNAVAGQKAELLKNNESGQLQGGIKFLNNQAIGNSRDRICPAAPKFELKDDPLNIPHHLGVKIHSDTPITKARIFPAVDASEAKGLLGETVTLGKVGSLPFVDVTAAQPTTEMSVEVVSLASEIRCVNVLK
jgi:hypothetical protein